MNNPFSLIDAEKTLIEAAEVATQRGTLPDAAGDFERDAQAAREMAIHALVAIRMLACAAAETLCLSPHDDERFEQFALGLRREMLVAGRCLEVFRALRDRPEKLHA